MSNNENELSTYKVGDVVNGFKWNGTAWVRYHKPLRYSIWFWLLIAGASVLVVTFLVNTFTEQRQDSSTVESGDDLRRDAYTECKVAVLGYLKSPGSADFPWYEPAFVTDLRPTFLVNAYVDAENSFGASVRTPWSCSVSNSGGRWVVNSVGVE